MKLVTLQLDAHKRRITRMEANSGTRKKMVTRITKTKGKKCYIYEEDSDENDDEVVYVAMKDESDEDEATTLVTYMNKNDKWIIGS